MLNNAKDTVRSLMPKAITEIMKDEKKTLKDINLYRLTYVWEGNEVIYITLDQNINRIINYLKRQGANFTHHSEYLIPADIGGGKIKVLAETILELQPKYNKCLPCLIYKPPHKLTGNIQSEIDKAINKNLLHEHTVKPNDLGYILNLLGSPRRALHGNVYYNSKKINWKQVINIYTRLKLV